MRLVAGVLAALIALLFVAAVGVYVVLPRILGEDFVRARLSEATRSAIGREIEFERLEVEWFPPAVNAFGAVIGDEAMPFARAERIQFAPALAPLLAGVLLIDSATVEGATIRLVRDRDEIAAAPAIPSGANRNAQPDLVVGAVSLSGAGVAFEDRTVDPTVHWKLRGVDASALVETASSVVRVGVVGDFAPRGRLVGAGILAFDGEVDLEFELESVDIATAGPYFAAGGDVGGLLTGSIRVTGRIESPAIELIATLREADFQLGDIALSGTLEVAARIRDALRAPHGQVELDATAAEVAYADFFTKPPGTPARVVGQVATGAGGSLAIEAWEFVMRDLDGHAGLGARDRFQRTDRSREAVGSSGNAPRGLTRAQMGGNHLKARVPEDDISACEGIDRLHSLCG